TVTRCIGVTCPESLILYFRLVGRSFSYMDVSGTNTRGASMVGFLNHESLFGDRSYNVTWSGTGVTFPSYVGPGGKSCQYGNATLLKSAVCASGLLDF